MSKLFTMHLIFCLLLVSGRAEAGEAITPLCRNVLSGPPSSTFGLTAASRFLEWPLNATSSFLSRWHKPLEKLSLENKELLKSIQNEARNSGLEIERIKVLKDRIQVGFQESPIFVDQKSLQTPPWVAQQKQVLKEWEKEQTNLQVYYPSSREYYGDRDSMNELLTAKTFSKLKPGRYAFVLLQGEKTLRLGYGHHILGEGRPALAAGDIEIRMNPHTRENEVHFLSARSDTYRPHPGSLPIAVQALWENGLFPTHFELRNWDNQEVFLSIESQ